MRKLILLFCCWLLIAVQPAVSIGWTLDWVEGPSGPAYGYAGYPNTNGVPNETPTTALSATADRKISSYWLATENGTAVSIILYVGSLVQGNDQSWVCLWKGTTLIGYGVIPYATATKNAWNEIALTVVGGQSLTFSASDALYIGYQYNYDSGATDNRTNAAYGSTSSVATYKYDLTSNISTSPIDAVSWTNSSNYDFGVILKYEK